MPRATASAQDNERIDLKSCPGGFVLLRRMSFDELLTRRGMASEIVYKNQNAGKAGKTDLEGHLKIAQLETAKWEFKNCIVDHNLEDDNGDTLDFRSPMSFSVLDPRIGQEISDNIDRMNQPLEEGELGNSNSESGQRF